MITRDQLQTKIAAVLKDQDYGYINAQPSIKGMSWALTNALVGDFGGIDPDWMCEHSGCVRLLHRGDVHTAANGTRFGGDQ